MSDLRSFLRTCGYVAKFIPNYANIVKPFRNFTRKEKKWSWGIDQAKAFKALKEAPLGTPLLSCFRVDAPIYVGTGECKPIEYINRSTERKYSQIEHEEVGCVWAVERLNNYLFGIKFTLLTDKKPLSKMSDPHRSKVLPPRIQPARKCKYSRLVVTIAIQER